MSRELLQSSSEAHESQREAEPATLGRSGGALEQLHNQLHETKSANWPRG